MYEARAHLHAKHDTTRESAEHASRKIWKFGSSKIEFQGILTLQKRNSDDDETWTSSQISS